MNDEILKNLIDILHAAEEIQRFTHEMDFKAYHKTVQLHKERLREILRLLEKPLTGLDKLIQN